MASEPMCLVPCRHSLFIYARGDLMHARIPKRCDPTDGARSRWRHVAPAGNGTANDGTSRVSKLPSSLMMR